MPPKRRNIAFDMEGEGKGLVGDAAKYVSSTAKKTVSAVKGAANTAQKTVSTAVATVKDVSNKLINGTTELPPNVLRMLGTYGTATINTATIVRVPLNGLLAGTLNVASMGSFGKELEKKPYDKNFHLLIQLGTSQGSIQLEKAAVITMALSSPVPKDGETFIVPYIPPGLTLQELVDNTQQGMGTGKFLGYSSKDNNCQDFIMGVLNANHMNSPDAQAFTKQDVASLFTDSFRKTANTVTGIGAKAEILMQGGRLANFLSQTGVINTYEPIDEMTTMRPQIHHHVHHHIFSQGTGTPIEDQKFSLSDVAKTGRRIKKSFGGGVPIEDQKFSLSDVAKTGRRIKKSFGGGVPIEDQKFSLSDVARTGNRLRKSFGGGVGDDDDDDMSYPGAGARMRMPHQVKGSQAARDHMARLRAMRGNK